jgi:hypothetical protein
MVSRITFSVEFSRTDGRQQRQNGVITSHRAAALRHTGSGRGRLLTMCHPAGIEEIFAATSAEERATMDKKYGAENVGPPLPI